MRAVIVSAQRSGGLYLAGCLSTHPDISCPREEIFKRESIWQQYLKLSHADLLDFVFSDPYYRAHVLRLTYDQIFNPEIANYIFDHKIKIIHLVREILPTVTSTLLAKQEIKNGIPRHWIRAGFEDTETLNSTPAEVIQRVKHLIKQRRNFKERFGGGRLRLHYEAILPEGEFFPSEPGRAICAFLDLDYYPLRARSRKMHARPVRDYFTNWTAIEAALVASFPEVLVID